MPNLARVRASLIYGAGGPGLGTFYFRPTGVTSTPAELADMVARVRAFYAALTTMLYSGLIVTVQGEVDEIDSATGDLTGSYSTTPPAAVVGTGGATQLPPTTCILVRLVTTTVVNRRILKGRTFVGPLASVASTTTGSPTTSVGSTSAAAVAALLAVASTEIPVVWHRPKAAGSGNWGPITGGSAWSSFGSLRSRRD